MEGKREFVYRYHIMDDKIMDEYHDVMMEYEYDFHNISQEDLPRLKELTKQWIKRDPNFIEAYLLLEEVYFRDRKRVWSQQAFEKAYKKALALLLGKEKKWPDMFIWGL